ncbi:MAG: dCTP deaminase [Chloroflexi bacterium]|nr:dCTP deaminase [Chloroflexota bacterium]
MILSDRSIKEAVASGRLGIEPWEPELVQPSSVDVRLDNKFLVFRNTKRAYIDVKQPADDLMEMLEVGPEEPMFLHPHEFVLGNTIERVRMPNDLVARLEGRSSLGRLGVVIHSSLPNDEPVLFLDRRGVLEQREIGELIDNRVHGKVVAFDRDTFEVGFHEVTNWFAEPPDKVYEVRLASGRRVRVTAGHNLFTLDAAGELTATPTGALIRGTRVAIPKFIPELPVPLVPAREATASRTSTLALQSKPRRRLDRLVEGGLHWDEVVDVVDTGRFEPVYDLEVRGSSGRVENFLAGSGGVFVSNTAGFIDPEFEGHVTLEISNLANLPIALYPGMRIGQISFSLMTTPAERPYGAARGSKYSGQHLPTASRLYLDFRGRE